MIARTAAREAAVGRSASVAGGVSARNDETAAEGRRPEVGAQVKRRRAARR